MFPDPFVGVTVNDPAEQIVDVWAITFGVGFTVIVPIAFSEPQPPVNGME